MFTVDGVRFDSFTVAPELSTRRTTCRICDAPDLEVVISLNPTPLASQFLNRGYIDSILAAGPLTKSPQPYFPLEVALCRGCGLVQLLDTVDPTYMYAQASERTSRDSPGMAEHFACYARALEARLPCFNGDTTGGIRPVVVEIGSNDGALLRQFQAHGATVFGIDPALETAAAANVAGIPTRAVGFSAAVAKTLSQADLIIANNVLANLDDLSDVAAGIQTLLKPDGVFVFETGYLGSLVEHVIFDNIYHEHLSYFSVGALMRWCEYHGLELFDVELVPTKGGSLRGFVQHKYGPHAHTTNIARMLGEEAAQRLDRPETYHAMKAKIDRFGLVVHDLVKRLQGAVMPFAGFGASHSCVTLMHQFELGRGMLSYVVDDNPVKHYLYTPGHRHLVYPAQFMLVDWFGRDNWPRYTLILPWRFADSIIAKYQRYRELGGRFIVPMPEMKIL